MASGWTDNETRALLQVWSEESVQRKLNTVSKKKPIYDAIARKLGEMGYTKTGEQCKTKIKNLLARYRKVKDGNRKSGTGADSSFPFFDDIDTVIGTRATSEPPILLDSGIPETSNKNADGKALCVCCINIIIIMYLPACIPYMLMNNLTFCRK